MALTVRSTLPFNIDSGRTRATVAFDSVVGPRISAIVDDFAGTPQSMNVCADLGSGQWQGGMWRINGRLRSGLTKVVTPQDAATYEVYEPVTLADSSVAHLHEWRDIPVGADDVLWVRVAVIVPPANQPGGQAIQFAGWAGHQKGGSFRIEFFVYPAMYVQTWADASGGTARQKAYQQRMHVPFTFTALRPGWSTNQSIGLGARPNITGESFWDYTKGEDTTGNFENGEPDFRGNIFHPMSNWLIAMCASAAVNPADAGSYLRTLMFMGRDKNPTGPWLKNLNWGIPQKDNDTDTHYFTWRPGHMPRLATDWALPTITVTSPLKNITKKRIAQPWRNSCGPQWIPEIHTFLSPSPAWWFHCAEKYREYYKAYRNPVPLETNAKISDVRRRGIIAATINLGYNNENLIIEDRSRLNEQWADWPARVRETFSWIPRWLGKDFAGIFHSNAWCEYRGSAHPLLNADFSGIRGEVPLVYEELQNLGWLTSAYLIHTEHTIAHNIWPSFLNVPLETTQVGGQERPKADTPLLLTNFGNFNIPRYNLITEHPDFADRIKIYFAFAAFFGRLKALYLDTLSGAYLPTPNTTGAHEAWGTPNITFYRRNLIDKTREFLGGISITSEAVCEWMEDLDWGAAGAPLYPWHQTNWEPELVRTWYSGSFPTELAAAPYEARVPSPPTWQAVHNEWNPQSSYAAMPTTANMAGSPLLNASPTAIPGYPAQDGGLTGAEWLPFVSFPMAANYTVGMHQLFWESTINYSAPPILDSSGRVQPYDTTGAGRTFMEFFRTLYQSLEVPYAGEFLMYGAMQAPLLVDYTNTTGNNQVTNPLKPANVVATLGGANFLVPTYQSKDEIVGTRRSRNWRFDAVPSHYFSHPASSVTGLDDGTVPAVLTSTWKKGNVVGVVIVNWTAANGRLIATATPALYGLSGTVTIRKRVRNGATTTITTSAASTFTIGDSLASATVNVGVIAPFSVTVLELTGS